MLQEKSITVYLQPNKLFDNQVFVLPLELFIGKDHRFPYKDAFIHETLSTRFYQLPSKILLGVFDPNNFDKQSSLYENNFKFGEFYLKRQSDSFKTCMHSKMSFDTVKFGVPCSPLEFEYYKQSFLPYRIFERKRLNQETESLNEKFRLVTPDEMDSLPSYNNEVTFYYSDSGYVIFEMSIPKQLYGHNSLMYWQLDTFFDRFRNYLKSVLNIEIDHWKNWLLKRVDICYNYYLNSLEEVENTLTYLSDLRMRNRPCIRNSSGNNIAYWAFQTRTIKFYSKYHEMLKHKKNFNPVTYDIVLENSKNILRFEEEWRSKYLLSKLNLTKVNEITVGRFLEYVIKEYDRDKHIIGLLGEATMIDKKFSLKETMDCIKQNFKKPVVYTDFVLSVIDKGLDKTKASMPKSTYYAVIKELKEVGIDPSVINERFHHGLESNNTKFSSDFYKSRLSNITDEEAMFIQSEIEPVTEQKVVKFNLREFLSSKDTRMTDFDGFMSVLPPEYQVNLFKQKA